MKLVSMLFVTALLSVSCASMKGSKCCDSGSCDKKMSCCDQKKGDCSSESCAKKKS
jgi:hypothetical protein